MTTKTATDEGKTVEAGSDKAGAAAGGADKPAPITPVVPEDTEYAAASEPVARTEAAPGAGTDPAAGRETLPAVETNRHGEELGKREDTRSRAARRFRELRDQERAAKEGGKPATPAAEAREDAPRQEAREPQRREERREERREPPQEDKGREARPQQEGSAAPPQTVTIKVDGREEVIPLDEALAELQTHRAAAKRETAAKRLDESKRQLKDVIAAQSKARPAPENPPVAREEQTDAAPSEPGQPQSARPQAQAEHPPRRAKPDKDKLRPLVEKIQIGDTDEGAEALAEVVEDAVALAVEQANARQANPDEIRRHTREEIVQLRLKAENEEALARFQDNYPELKTKRHLAHAAASVVADEIAEDLRRVGLQDEDLDPIRSDPAALARVHGQARMMGLAVRKPAEVLDAAGEVLVREFNIRRSGSESETNPEPNRQAERRTEARPSNGTGNGAANGADPALAERQAAKRAQAQQPRTAGMRAPAPQAPRPRSKEEYVQDLRRARGFATYRS